MKKNTDNVIFEGLEVTKNYYSNDEPLITHGLFRFRNKTNAIIGFEVRQLNCMAGNAIIEIPNYYLYRLPGYQELGQAEFELQPDGSMDLEISFPGISVASILHEKVWVELQILIGGNLKFIKSPYKIWMRTARKVN